MARLCPRPQVGSKPIVALSHQVPARQVKSATVNNSRVSKIVVERWALLMIKVNGPGDLYCTDYMGKHPETLLNRWKLMR